LGVDVIDLEKGREKKEKKKTIKSNKLSSYKSLVFLTKKISFRRKMFLGPKLMEPQVI